MGMLSELEVRNWRDRERERMECAIVDPVEHRCRCIAVAVLDGVLND